MEAINSPPREEPGPGLWPTNLKRGEALPMVHAPRPGQEEEVRSILDRFLWLSRQEHELSGNSETPFADLAKSLATHQAAYSSKLKDYNKDIDSDSNPDSGEADFGQQFRARHLFFDDSDTR